MFNNIGKTANVYLSKSKQLFLCKYNHTQKDLAKVIPAFEEKLSIVDSTSLPDNDFANVQFEKKSPLEDCTEDISHVAPYLKPTFNFAAYVNKSDTLQQLLKLGVNLHKLEQKVTVPQFIMGLDFERDIKKYVQFFNDIGLSVDDIACIVTNNPYILKQDVDDLKVRINYLLCKKFTEDMILRILSRNPFWLMFSTERIDRRLGFFQKQYNLTGNEIRTLATKQPKLITYSISHVKLNNFVLKEEMGFSDEEIKEILLNKPKIFMKNQKNMLATYDFLVDHMKIPLQMIVTWPGILTCRYFRIKERHLFLEKLGKAQYDPKVPNYISPLTVVSSTDGEFAVEVAKSSLQAYNAFLKSL